MYIVLVSSRYLLCTKYETLYQVRQRAKKRFKSNILKICGMNKTKLPPADKQNASFKWKVNLTDKTNADYIIGYSKFIGNPEAAQKGAVFKSKIIMLAEKGYLLKADNIEFYDNQKQELLVILEFDKFQAAPKLIATEFYSFLVEFYERLNNNRSLSDLLQPKINFSKDMYLQPENLGLVSLNRLEEYCNTLRAMGFSAEITANFKEKYRIKYKI